MQKCSFGGRLGANYRVQVSSGGRGCTKESRPKMYFEFFEMDYKVICIRVLIQVEID